MSIQSSDTVSEVVKANAMAPAPRPKRKHARPASTPKISLYQPGRLRVSDLQALFALSHTVIYRRMKQGLIPLPDGWDMPDQPKGHQGRPYWLTDSIRPYLEPKVS